MKVLVAIDSFKGSLTSEEVSNAVSVGIRNVEPDAEIVKVTIADGGEGTVATLINELGGEYITTEVSDPLRRRIKAQYGVLPDDIVIIETASAAGLTLLKDSERDPAITTTYGLGEMIIDAINRGYRKFFVGLGGSATNDAGMGMLEALGFKFYDENGRRLKGCGIALTHICDIDVSDCLSELAECQFTLLSDVTNPLFGENGAAYVFAPQKGANEWLVDRLDEGLRNFAGLVKEIFGRDIANISGAGAAGGLGGGFLGCLNSKIVKGIDTIMHLISIEDKLQGCDLIITGEGKMDGQSVMGKVPYGMAKLGKKYDIPVIGLCGALKEDAYSLHTHGMTALFSVMNYPMSLEEALDKTTAVNLVIQNTEEIIRLIKAFK